jgi:hypothetical protein
MLFQNTECSTQRQTLGSPYASRIKTMHSQHLPSTYLHLPVATVCAYFLPRGQLEGAKAFEKTQSS